MCGFRVVPNERTDKKHDPDIFEILKCRASKTTSLFCVRNADITKLYYYRFFRNCGKVKRFLANENVKIR